MLLELAIGDAYGAGFEYAEPTPSRPNDLSTYRQHPKHPLRPGQYTDDTQMSLALAELMLQQTKWTRENIAAKFVEVFHRDPREGYAGRFYDFLCVTKTGEDFLKNMKPDSDKSGAAMRAPVIGLFPSLSDVMIKTELQAKITHNTADGVFAAQASALMTHYFWYDLGRKTDLGKFIAQYVPGQWDIPWTGKVGPKGWMSVRAAITAVMNADWLSHVLRDCIDFTGDVDTVAAIAMAAASCSKEIKQDLPVNLISMLEVGQYGRDYIVLLDAQLKFLFRR